MNSYEVTPFACAFTFPCESLALLLFCALLRSFAVANEQILEEPRVEKEEGKTERVDAVSE